MEKLQKRADKFLVDFKKAILKKGLKWKEPYISSNIAVGIEEIVLDWREETTNKDLSFYITELSVESFSFGPDGENDVGVIRRMIGAIQDWKWLFIDKRESS